MAPEFNKKIFWAVIGAVFGILGICILITIIFLTVTPHTPQLNRKKMAEYYSNCEYLTIYGTIDDCYYSSSAEYGASITFKLDEDWINSLSEEQLDSFKKAGLSVTSAPYSFVPKCKKALQDNGFFDLLKTNERGYLYSEETITIIVNNRTWHQDDIPYAVGLSVGDTVYLDFETGKELLIDYIQHDMY